MLVSHVGMIIKINFEKNKILYEGIALGKMHGCESGQLALSWLLHHGDVVSQVGTTKINNMEENLNFLKARLTQ
eukprot:Gb_00992 [translate_table: standard]